MGIIRGMFLTAVVAASVFGCAKDQTVKEYNDREALDELAKYQAVEGRYSGLLTNDAQKRPLGGLELVLQARIASDAGSGQSSSSPSSTAKAVLITELHFQDTRYTQMSASSGYYDPNSGIYQADFVIDSSHKLSITGHIGDGHLTGSMQGVGFETQSASFDLVVNGSALADLSKLGKPSPVNAGEGQMLTYPGKFRWDSTTPMRNMELHAYFPIVTPLQHFIELFLPDTTKTLQVDIKFSEDLDVMFSQASWDSQTGTVIATESVKNTSGDPVTQQLRCRGFYFAATRAPFACQFWTNRTSVTTINLQPPVAPSP